MAWQSVVALYFNIALHLAEQFSRTTSQMAVFCCFFCLFNLRPIKSHAIPQNTMQVVEAAPFPAVLRTERPESEGHRLT